MVTLEFSLQLSQLFCICLFGQEICQSFLFSINYNKHTILDMVCEYRLDTFLFSLAFHDRCCNFHGFVAIYRNSCCNYFQRIFKKQGCFHGYTRILVAIVAIILHLFVWSRNCQSKQFSKNLRQCITYKYGLKVKLFMIFVAISTGLSPFIANLVAIIFTHGYTRILVAIIAIILYLFVWSEYCQCKQFSKSLGQCITFRYGLKASGWILFSFHKFS